MTNGDAKISFDDQFGDIVADWPTHRDVIHVGTVYIPYHMLDEANRRGWKRLNEPRSAVECAQGLIKVQRLDLRCHGLIA